MHGVSNLDQIKGETVNPETEVGHRAGSPYGEENVSVIKVVENDKKEEFLSDFRAIESYQPNFGSRIDCVSLRRKIVITYF